MSLRRFSWMPLVAALFMSEAWAGGVAIDGYDAVSYVERGKARKGLSSLPLEHAGKTYLFAGRGARKRFRLSPESYAVQYDGWCATALSLGTRIPIDPELFTVIDGRIYLFSNGDAKQTFDADPQAMAEKADAAWARMETPKQSPEPPAETVFRDVGPPPADSGSPADAPDEADATEDAAPAPAPGSPPEAAPTVPPEDDAAAD